MANVNAPLGFRPVKRLDGAAYTGAFTPYRIASGYNTNIFSGDVAKLVGTGYINRAAPGDSVRGVLIGVSFTDATGKPQRLPYWPAGTLTLGGQDATAFVIDDPNVVFEAQLGNLASLGIWPVEGYLGMNANILATAGNPATGLSAEQLDGTTLTTAAAQWRILEFVNRPDNDFTTSATASINPKVWCVPALHDFRVNTGI